MNFILRILHCRRPQNMISMINFLHDPQHVANIHVNGARAFGGEVPIFGDRLVGGIKIQTNQFAALVHHRRSRVTACGVGAGEEVDAYSAECQVRGQSNQLSDYLDSEVGVS